MTLVLLAAMVGGPTWHKVEGYKGFEGLPLEVQRLVDEDSDTKAPIQHVCMVVRQPSDPHDGVGPVAFVHIPEQAYIYAFNQTVSPPIDGASIWGGGSIDLKRGVVPATRDIRGGLAVTRAYVSSITTACARHGTSLVLKKRHV